jgi:hypothetical protein
MHNPPDSYAAARCRHTPCLRLAAEGWTVLGGMCCSQGTCEEEEGAWAKGPIFFVPPSTVCPPPPAPARNLLAPAPAPSQNRLLALP